MKYVLIAAVALMIAGCASTAAPNFFNGNYYMAGDSSCVRVRQLSSTRVMCMDKKGNDTGYRDAMTYEQMQAYQLHVLNQQVQMQQITQKLQQTGQTFHNAGHQILQQSQQYTAPQVQPIAPQGAYSGTSYRRVGDTVVGSDGSRCLIVGQSILCSDGKKCQIAGQNLICN